MSRDWVYDGSQGTDFEAFLGVPTVDFGAFHLYPDTYGMPGDFGTYWIRDHIDAGVRAGKPVVLTEYGLKDNVTRGDIYQRWLGQIYASNAVGDVFWMLAGVQDDRTRYPDFGQFTLYAATAPASVRDHAAQMTGRR